MGPEYDSIVREALAELGLEVAEATLGAIEAHARLLMAWSAHINLTALRTEAQIALLHVVDSLTAAPLLREPGTRGRARAAVTGGSGAGGSGAGAARPGRGLTILDLGSGGGYPGLPLAIVLGARRAALVDSVGKKVRFLEAASAAVGRILEASATQPADLVAVLARAEELAAQPAQPAHRERWDVVTARAVGSLSEVAELGLPLIRTGGRLIAWKRDGDGSLAAELDAARQLVHAAGGEVARIHPSGIAALPDHRLVELRKVRPSPARYPRHPAERRRG
ncbi:MAG: rRNA (guanine527-N7)-methyltransferase [Chloroflexota bacterium]|jgi:16S rRNA (guanine527-N7)-methyltransferase|nr:rRNA (guanine527-N7)-methyltransferase [Chloroflexota bacterium]